MALNPKLQRALRNAIKHFWTTRDAQAMKQGSKTGSRDAGARTAVTGGRQMDGFVSLVRDYLCENGLPKTQVYCKRQIELPGWYRPEKQWDLLVVENGQFLAGIEFKSQVGSFGNNYNNRTEEAIGSACDLWAAYREGAFKPSARPWLGYLIFGGCGRLVTTGACAGASLQGFPRIQRCVVRKALRDSPNKARA